MTAKSHSHWEGRGWRLRLLQAGWMLLFALMLTISALNVPYVYRQQLSMPTTGRVPVSDPDTLRALLLEAGISPSQHALHTLLTRDINFVFVLPIALLIFVKRSSDRGALVVSLLLMTQALSGNTSGYPFIGEALGAEIVGQIVGQIAYVIGASSFILFFVFPDGRFVPRWTRWVAAAFVAVFTLEAFTSFRAADVVLIYPLALTGIASSIYAQVYRYRRVSGPVERQQTRWAMLGLIMTPATWLLSGLILALFPAASEVSGRGLRIAMVAELVFLPFYLMGPVGIAVALLRYRLYDVDVVIRRTLIYSTLTVLLAGVYLGGVTLLQSLFVGLIRGEAPLAIVLSTLGTAALFTPIRHRVQRFIDRAFFRQRYNAEQTLAQFGAAVQSEVDIEGVEAALLRAVDETLQPTSAGLWVKKESA